MKVFSASSLVAVDLPVLPDLHFFHIDVHEILSTIVVIYHSRVFVDNHLFLAFVVVVLPVGIVHDYYSPELS